MAFKLTFRSADFPLKFCVKSPPDFRGDQVAITVNSMFSFKAFGLSFRSDFSVDRGM